MNSHQTGTERRRSERAIQSLPVVVRGVDLLGQPFEERTTTLAFNRHGCRYTSKHHLPRNSWVTLELPRSVSGSASLDPLRARVAWVQRPHSIRDFFQIAVELETPASVWKPEATPAGEAILRDFPSPAAPGRTNPLNDPMNGSVEAVAGDVQPNRTNQGDEAPGFEPTQYSPSQLGATSPLIRELRVELERQAKEAAADAAQEARRDVLRIAEESERKHSAQAEESLEKWTAQLNQMQQQALSEYAQHVSAQQDGFLRNAKLDLNSTLDQARELMSHLNHQTETLRSVSQAAHEKNIEVTRSLSQLESAESARTTRLAAGQSEEDRQAEKTSAAAWRRRLDAEMHAAQKQWNELLQSSLDGSLHHMVGQISDHSQAILQNAEKKMTARVAELREPFSKAADEARDTIASIQASLNREVLRARESLTEVEQVAGRTKEISGQLEAASHDTLNQLHQRLEKILDTHTTEMNRRAEGISANLSQRVTSSLDLAGHQFLERTIAETEGKLTPHLERIPTLLHELDAREVQTEEGLRVHRERLRQLAENNYRDVEAQIAATRTNLQVDFEAARKDALGKWSEELDASGVRAAHSATEALGRTSEWFQQEARARLQVLVEQAMVTASSGLTEKTAAATSSFEIQLAAQTAAQLSQISRQVGSLGNDVAAQTRTELDRAAEAAAASFGQVLNSEADRQMLEFRAATSGIQRERAEQFEHTTQELLHKLDVNAWSSVENFRNRMAEHLETSVTEGRSALGAEFASTLENYRVDRETDKQKWIQHLESVSGEATASYQEKLQTAGDAWVVSSMRRLNDHGQNGIETLLKTADQALRDSFAKVFEGLSEMLRERNTNASAAGNGPGFGKLSNRDISEASSSPRNNVI